MMETARTWKKKCLTALMILTNGLVLTHTSPAKEVDNKTAATVSSFHPALRHIRERSNYYLNVSGVDGKMSKRMRNWHRLVRELESIILILRNVIGKYDMKKEELKLLYPGVSGCGHENCGKFPELLPKYRKLEQFRCNIFKNPKGLKKRTSKLLTFFQEDVQTFENSFQKLIHFENLTYYKKRDLSNGSRLQIIKELHTYVKTLKEEIIEVVNTMKNKRLNSQPSTMAVLGRPVSQTDLMLYEWRTIQQSKEFLEKWQKHIDRVFRCWEKMSRKGFRKNFKQKKKIKRPKTVFHQAGVIKRNEIFHRRA